MFRAAVALVSAVVFAPSTGAQPGPLPLAPGVFPGSTIGPGMPFVPQAGPRFVPPRVPGAVVPPHGPFGYGFFGFGGYYPPYAGPVVVIVEPPAAGPARRPEPSVVLANEFPAILNAQFPAPARVWLNGKELPGGAKGAWALESPALPVGTAHTFEFEARWELNGKTYTAKRAVPVRAGDRSRLQVVSGTEVRE